MRAALIRGDIVENLILVGPGYEPERGLVLVPIGDEPVDIGAVWDGANFSPPPPVTATVPEQVTKRQACVALLNLGLLDDVEAMLQAIPDPQQRRIAQVTWDTATVVRRDNELIAMLAPTIGLTEAQVDDLFRAAEGL